MIPNVVHIFAMTHISQHRSLAANSIETKRIVTPIHASLDSKKVDTECTTDLSHLIHVHLLKC